MTVASSVREPKPRSARSLRPYGPGSGAPRVRGSIPPPAHPRDQDASTFAPILAMLVTRVPGAYAAALVDGEGETVDYFSVTDPFEVKVAAAHWRIVLAEITERAAALGRPRGFVVRAARRSFVIRALPEDYALVLALRRRAGFSESPRAFEACIHALCREACWPSETAPEWFPVVVQCDRRGRPCTVRWLRPAEGVAESQRRTVEVLGRLVGVVPRRPPAIASALIPALS